LSVGEAAGIAGVSRTHVWRLARAGAFPAVVVGERSGPIRIPREAFLAWLASRRLERGR
jgi:excisionase family DNA binding protein